MICLSHCWKNTAIGKHCSCGYRMLIWLKNNKEIILLCYSLFYLAYTFVCSVIAKNLRDFVDLQCMETIFRYLFNKESSHFSCTDKGRARLSAIPDLGRWFANSVLKNKTRVLRVHSMFGKSCMKIRNCIGTSFSVKVRRFIGTAFCQCDQSGLWHLTTCCFRSDIWQCNSTPTSCWHMNEL